MQVEVHATCGLFELRSGFSQLPRSPAGGGVSKTIWGASRYPMDSQEIRRIVSKVPKATVFDLWRA